MKLVLFDIDGTVLLSDGAGKRAVQRALVEVFGSSGPADHRFDGKTDAQIVRELLRADGYADDHIDGHMPRAIDRYVELLHEELDAPGYSPRALPGVIDLLEALEARDDAIVGLLTGNVVEGAKAKLAAVGIDPERFEVGAFGSDHERRTALPAIARDRLRDSHGHEMVGEDIVIIGDTPSDIECGRSIGVRAIGVATGHFSVADLLACGAYAAFEDLSDTAAVVDAIFRTTR
ncbi:MAG TPA: haloacid dehalogenase-like hydrolase [Gemmatimonadaceae bacterium]